MCGCDKRNSHCGCGNRGFQPPQPSISIGVQNLLGCDCILFTGNYDKNNWNLTPSSTEDNNVATNVVNLIINNSGYNSITATTIFNKAKPFGSPSFYTENYYLGAFNNSLQNKLGEVNFQATYPELGNEGGITSGGIQKFDVSSNSGIFKNIKHVIIDFNNDVRVLYFIGKC